MSASASWRATICAASSSPTWLTTSRWPSIQSARRMALSSVAQAGAAALAFAIPVALFTVHFDTGFFRDKGGCEYALALCAASLSLPFTAGRRLAVGDASACSRR